MKHLCAKSLLTCVLLLCFLFTRAQDLEQTELLIQVDHYEQTQVDSLQIFLRNAQYQQAIDYINLLEPTKELLYQKALCYKNLNNYSSAIDILNALSEEYPDDISPKLQLALCYEVTAQYMKSFNCYNQLLKIDSTNTYFEVRKADLLYRSEKYTAALDAYGRIDSTYSPNYIARCMGMCYEKLNKQEEAKQYFSKAWELNDRDAYSASSLVKLYIKEENFLPAYEYSEKFIKSDSTNATMNALNAYVYYNMNYYDIAKERFAKCLLQGDSSLLVNRSLGFTYYMFDMDSLACVFLRQAFQQDTTNNNVLYILGKTYHKLGNYPEAIDCFLKMLDKLIPSDILLYTVQKELGSAYEKNEEFHKAVSAYNKAVSYSKDNATKMDLFFSMATLCDVNLKDYSNAAYFYKQYYSTLLNYQSSSKDEKEINEIESKLTSLEKYIREITDKAEKERKEMIEKHNQEREKQNQEK